MDRNSLAQLLRDALAHLHDLFYLESHPLATVLANGGEHLSGARLRQLLVAAIDDMKPRGTVPLSHADWRRYQHLVLRYLDGSSVEQIERKLQISARQASRDHQQAIELLANHFWLQVTRPHAGAFFPSPDSPLDTISEVEQSTQVTHEEPAGESDEAELLDTLQGVVRTLRRLVRDHAVRFLLNVPDTLPPVAFPRVVLRQALLHLLMYAVEQETGGPIRISAADRPAGVILSIEVPAADNSKAPDRPSPKPKESFGDLYDMGRWLLEAHRGTVDCVRRGDLAAEVSIVLPPSRQTMVLVIDDNPDMVDLFRRFLRGEAYRMVQATNGEDGLRLAEALQPDIIFLDVVMPLHDGWDILASLQSLLGQRDVPVIICSVLAEHSLAHSLGATDFLAKPFTRQALLRVLEQWSGDRGKSQARS